MNLPKILRKTQAFTLIELLISVSIIAIITGALIPTFSTYLRGQNIKQSQEQLKSDLRSAQNRALNGSLSDELVSGQLMQYWGLKFTQNNATYFTFISNVATATACNNAVSKETYKLGNEALIKSSSGCLFFDISNGNITKTWSGSDEVIVGFSGTDSSNKKVLFNRYGLIYSTL